jgi:predicted small secreted protein
MRHPFTLLLALLIAAWLGAATGCDTLAGFGKDVQAVSGHGPTARP